MTDEKPAQVVKPRHPVERAVVWGFIGVALIVVGVEAKAHFGFSGTLGQLNTRLQELNNADQGFMNADEVHKIVGKAPDDSQNLKYEETGIGAGSKEVYKYAGLLRTREIHVYYGIKGKGDDAQAEVLTIGTGDEETLEQSLARIEKEMEASAPPAGAGAGAAGGPTGAGPMGPGPMGMGPMGPMGPGGAGRPASKNKQADDKATEGEDKKSDDAPPADAEKPAEEKPAAEDKPATEDKPAEEKPAAETTKPE